MPIPSRRPFAGLPQPIQGGGDYSNDLVEGGWNSVSGTHERYPGQTPPFIGENVGSLWEKLLPEILRMVSIFAAGRR